MESLRLAVWFAGGLTARLRASPAVRRLLNTARRRGWGARRLGLAAGLLACWASVAAAPPSALAGGAESEGPTTTLRIRADRPDGNCYAFWRVGNFNQPHLFIDPNHAQEIREACPFVREVNAVYFLGGRWEGQNAWYQGTGPDGNVRADFTGMIAQLKGMIAMGLRPRIVLDNVPFNMSDPPQLNAYGNTAPPADEKVWRRYVKAAIEAMVRAFGRETVAGWHFRVGTEPDLRPAHWAGTKEQWLAHYDYTVDALAIVLPEAKVGPGNILNPAAPAGVPRAAAPAGSPRAAASASGASTRFARVRWGLDIIDHCAEGNNACTGGRGARMDHFSCSWYGRVGGSLDQFDSAMNEIRKRLARYPRLANLPVEVGEFAVLGDENGRRLYAGDTTEWSASFYAALADRVYAQNVLDVYEWDQATHGVMHPKGHVIGMLERMAGGRRLPVQVEGNSPQPCGAVACERNGRLLVLLYNHRAERAPGNPRKVRLELLDPALRAAQAWRVSEWAVDANHASWSYEFDADCAAAGLKMLPGAGLHEGNPTRLYGPPGETVFAKNRQKYLRLSEVPQTRRQEPLKADKGMLALEMILPGHSVRLLELSRGE